MNKYDGLSAREIISQLQMQPIEHEGAYWAPGDRIATMNSIIALITNEPSGFSAMHRLEIDEGWQWLSGAAIRMLLLAPDGSGRELTLDADNPQVIVPRGYWQGALTLGEWSMISCWCAPAFEYEHFALGMRDELQAKYPSFADRIEELTRFD